MENVQSIAQKFVDSAASADVMALAKAYLALLEDRARFPDKPDFVGSMIEAHIGNLKLGKENADKHAVNAMRKLERLAAALTPDASTKGAYIGEFKITEGRSRPVTVPWTTIKEIMAAIRKRGGLK